ncbi:MAG: hypothetical protein M3O36_03900 [Myxococcota bacterium]|nr:hypothetical protein [Myxococcota bacterium]
MSKERVKKSGRPPKPIRPSDELSENDRPTVNPPFDLEAFARASAAADDVRSSAAAASAPTQRPPPRSAVSEPAGRSLLSIANEHAPSQPNFPAMVLPQNPSAEGALLGALGGLGGVGGRSSPEITGRRIEDASAEMRERFSLGDYTGALEIADLLLAEEPGNPEATDCREHCRSVLEKMYTARLGPLDRVALVTVPRAQMRWLSMDHRAGFVLSLIDGSSTVEMILDVCGMPRLDALRILQELVQHKIVAFR